jgi:hypothetical protein
MVVTFNVSSRIEVFSFVDSFFVVEHLEFSYKGAHILSDWLLMTIEV